MAGSRRSGNRVCARVALLIVAGAISVVAPVAPAHAQMAAIHVQAASDPFSAFVTEAAQRFGVPAAWIRAVMRAESHGDRRAISPKGALGLMQLMPDTWAGLRIRYDLGPDPYDPRDNILAGAAYLREMHVRRAHRLQIARLRTDPRAMPSATSECMTCRRSRRSPKACSSRSRRQGGRHDCAHSTSSEAERPILSSRLSGARAGADERTQASGQAISATTDPTMAR